jgi:hypothetical protein
MHRVLRSKAVNPDAHGLRPHGMGGKETPSLGPQAWQRAIEYCASGLKSREQVAAQLFAARDRARPDAFPKFVFRWACKLRRRTHKRIGQPIGIGDRN